jgi:hypothetical protein
MNSVSTLAATGCRARLPSNRPSVQTAVEHPGPRMNQDPIAHGEVSGVGMNGKRQLDRSRLRQPRQARAMNHGDPHGHETRLVREEVEPAEARKRPRRGEVGMIGHRPAHGMAPVV